MKIFVLTPYSRDANSFWRCMGPLSYLAKNSGGKIEITLPPDGQNIGWDRLSDFDLVFMHRPCRAEDVTLLQLARTLNIPVWSDYDDWLFHLPEWNPNKGPYHNAITQRHMATAVACSDVVSVSTSALYTEFSKINSNVVILPNAYRSDLFQFRGAQPPARKEHFVWRGTNTHDGDLLSVKNAFPQLSKKIDFLGNAPYFISHMLSPDQYKVHDFVDPMLYWRWIYQLSPKVWLFPLVDDFFNRCKSNISYIEAIHAGAICVAPDMPEWRHPGIVTYQPGNSESFLAAAESAMAMDEISLKSTVAEAYDYIKEKYDIKLVNEIRQALVYSLLSPGFKRNPRDPFNQLTAEWSLSIIKNMPLTPESY